MKTVYTVITLIILSISLNATAFGLPKIKKPDLGSAQTLLQLKNEFVNPVSYKPSLEKALTKFIEKNVNFQAEALGLKDKKAKKALIIKEKLSFNNLVAVENKDALQEVIKSSCVTGLCTYSAIEITLNSK